MLLVPPGKLVNHVNVELDGLVITVHGCLSPCYSAHY